MVDNAEEIQHVPTDFEILSVLNGGRNLPANIADETGYNPQYVRDRLAHLRRWDMVQTVGKRERGLAEITARGELALNNRDLWASGDRDEYHELIADGEVD